jgi:MYXO-CTERM domain-containing protein
MKNLNLSRLVSTSALVSSLVLVPLVVPASAQTSSGTNSSPSGTSSYQQSGTGNRDRGFDWGWIGLFGLIGLAGLTGRRHEEPTRYRDPDDVTARSNIR